MVEPRLRQETETPRSAGFAAGVGDGYCGFLDRTASRRGKLGGQGQWQRQFGWPESDWKFRCRPGPPTSGGFRYTAHEFYADGVLLKKFHFQVIEVCYHEWEGYPAMYASFASVRAVPADAEPSGLVF